MKNKTSIWKVILILLIIVITNVITNYLTKKQVLDFNAIAIKVEHFSIFSSSQPNPQGTTYEGSYDKIYKGKRVWHKIDNELWIELYPDSKEHIFHLYRKIRKDKPNNCAGDIVQRVSIKAIPGNDRMYAFAYDYSWPNQIFMPSDINCSNNLLDRSNDVSQWKITFPVYPYH